MPTHRRSHPPDPRVAKRLAAILAYHEVKPTDLAERVGINRSSVSQWLSGETAMSDKNAHRVAGALGEDPDFVLCRKDTSASGYGAALQRLSDVLGGDTIRQLLELDPEDLKAKIRRIIAPEDDSRS